MLLPRLDKAGFQLFVQQLEWHLKGKLVNRTLLIGDGAAAHTTQP